MIPELRDYKKVFTEITRESEELTVGLSDEQFIWRPEENRWSVGECLSHLNTLGYQLLPRLESAIEQGHKQGITGSPPFRYSLLNRLFIRANSPSSGFRMKTFKVYLPEPNRSLNKAEVMTSFTALQDSFRTLTGKADGLDLKRIKIASPASRLLRLSLGTWFAGTIEHEKRHLLQARKTHSLLAS